MNYSPPFFSVILPCFNSEKTLAQTLQSIKSQKFNDFELIAVNDGSTDSTLKILEGYRASHEITIISQENKGLGVSRNIAINAARGESLAFIDSDDMWLEEKLSIVNNFIASTNSDLICHDEFILKDNKILGVQKYGPYSDYRSLLIKGNCLSPSAVCIKTKLTKDLNGFSIDPRGHGVEDYDLWLRVSRSGGRIEFIRNILGICRIHDSNMSSQSDYRDREDFILEQHYDYFKKKYPKDLVLIDRRKSMQYAARGWDEFLKANFKNAYKLYVNSFMLCPLHPKLWKYIIFGPFKFIKVKFF